MKKLLLLGAFFLAFFSALTQDLTTHGNGLIYNPATVTQLKFIVDSMNIQFKSCEKPKQFYSLYQTKGNYLRIRAVKKEIKTIIDMIMADASLEEVLKVCKDFDHEFATDQYISLFREQNYNKDFYFEYEVFSIMNRYSAPSIRIETDENTPLPINQKSPWVIEKPWGDSLQTLEALYIENEFSRKPLPEVYNQMILYSECMVDTNTQVFLSDNWSSIRDYSSDEKTEDKELKKLYAYISNKTSKFPEKKKYAKQHEWKVKAATYVIENVNTDQDLKKLLDQAVDEVIEKGSSNIFLEALAEQYSKEKALLLKRNRRVMGGCSQDLSPRYHAQDIAILAAETYNWEVFLRSHLDIMNDRFARVSDGSYAWGARKTYLRELEELNINTLDLLIGISLMVDNPADNHYFGNIGRLGRALAETQNQELLETSIFTFLQDESLDELNRLRLYWLYMNTVYNYPKEIREEELKKFKEISPSLPAYLSKNLIETEFEKD